MTSYEGFCRGGPWDGKQYANSKSVFQIEMIDGVSWAGVLCDDEVPLSVVIVAGEYRHVAGQWIWYPYNKGTIQ